MIISECYQKSKYIHLKVSGEKVKSILKPVLLHADLFHQDCE